MANPLKWFGDQAKAMIRRELDRMMRQAGEAWQAKARELVPVKSGKLRDSIGYAYNTEKQQLVVYANMSYAGFLEFGTRFMKAQPFMRPALSAIPRIFRGSTTLQLPELAEKYQKRTTSFARGKTRGVKFSSGHGNFK